MVITAGRVTFTSNFGKTKAKEPKERMFVLVFQIIQNADLKTRGQRSELTVLLDLKGMADLLPSVSGGSDLIGSLGGLWDDGVGEVQEAPVDGLVQPLGNTIGVGILQKQGNSRRWEGWGGAGCKGLKRQRRCRIQAASTMSNLLSSFMYVCPVL